MKIVCLTDLKGNDVYVNMANVAYWRETSHDANGNLANAHTVIRFAAMASLSDDDVTALEVRVRETPAGVAIEVDAL